MSKNKSAEAGCIKLLSFLNFFLCGFVVQGHVLSERLN